MVYFISKRVLWPIARIFTHRVQGLENIPNGPCILAMNHESLIDGPLIIMMMAYHKNRRIFSFATPDTFRTFPWPILFKHFGAVRTGNSFEKALAVLKEGGCVSIFPEAKRTFSGKIEKVHHSGLGALALAAKVPVVPIGLRSFEFWSRFRTLPTFRHTIAIDIGKPMKFKGKPTRKNAFDVIRKVMKVITVHAQRAHDRTVK